MSEPELNPLQADKIVALYKKGLSGEKISKKLRVNQGRVWRKLWELKLPQKRIARGEI